jgi:hypothetical protein
MIDPHVLHGGASVWFCIAANELGFGAGFASTGGADTVTFGGAGASTFAVLSSEPATGSSRMFTPARNCASGERNLLAIHRKM